MFGKEQESWEGTQTWESTTNYLPFKGSPESKIRGSGRQCATRDEGLLRDLAQELDSQMSLVNFSQNRTCLQSQLGEKNLRDKQRHNEQPITSILHDDDNDDDNDI